MEVPMFWHGWQDAQWTPSHAESARDYRRGRADARRELERESERHGAGFQIVYRQDLAPFEGATKIDRLWARRARARKVAARDRHRETPLAGRLSHAAQYLATCYDVDVELVAMLGRVERWRESARQDGALDTLQRLWRYVDVFPRFGRLAGEPAAMERLNAVHDDLGVGRNMSGVRHGIERVRECYRAALEGDRTARKRMEREARVVRLTLAQGVERAFRELKSGKWNRWRFDRSQSAAARWERELQVAMGG